VLRYIPQLICVISFERTKDIRLRQAQAEKAFTKQFTTQSEQTNVPDDFDPTTPRLVFSDARRQLTISQLAVQLVMGFDRASKKTLDETFSTVEKSVHELFKGFDHFMGKKAIRETAAVAVLNYPQDQSVDSMHAHLHERFIKVPARGDLASINLQLGYKTKDDYFLNLTASVYQLFTKEFSPPVMPGAVNIELKDPIERGFVLKVDINSKPQRQKNRFDEMQDAKPLMRKLRTFLLEEADTFMGLNANG
jgi:hypothetical protein